MPTRKGCVDMQSVRKPVEQQINEEESETNSEDDISTFNAKIQKSMRESDAYAMK